jgi:hypothetical protein
VNDEPATNDPPPPESGAEFRLAPSDPDAHDNLRAVSTPPRSDLTDPWAGRPAQFSLGEFLLWIAIVSIGLSGLAWIAPPIFAGLCGFLALAVLIVTLIWNPQAPLFQLVWYALLAMYMISIVIAILVPPH